MKNRFFDIDKNVYLNSLYIIVILNKIKNKLEIEELLICFYLMKYPKIFIDIAKSNHIQINADCFHDYDLDNIESNMLKFSMRIHTEGLYEAISYLASKDIISFSAVDNLVIKGNFYKEIDFLAIPQYLLIEGEAVVNIIETLGITKVLEAINKLEEIYYEQ